MNITASITLVICIVNVIVNHAVFNAFAGGCRRPAVCDFSEADIRQREMRVISFLLTEVGR